MKLLLDTHTLIWVITNSAKLPEKIKTIVNNKNNIIYVSVASLWEIEIKHLKKAELMPYDAKSILRAIERSDFELIDVKKDYILGLEPIVNQSIHSDPFDHLLISMAKNDDLTLITHDSKVKEYKDVDVIAY